MTWARIAQVVQRYRQNYALAGGLVSGLFVMLALEDGLQLGPSAATKVFVLWFGIGWVLSALVLTFLLAYAEHRVDQASRPSTELPRAVARDATPPTEREPDPTATPGDGPGARPTAAPTTDAAPRPSAPAIASRPPDPQPPRGDEPTFLGAKRP